MKVVVVGSLNMDVVISVDDLPRIGETIEGNKLNYFLGGKGANQAVAAARLGVETRMIGAIGLDAFGEKIKNNMIHENIIIDGLIEKEGYETGMATILKTIEDNSIVIIKGANEACDISLIEENEKFIKESDVLVTQFEIPMETVRESLKIAKKHGVKTIVNPAPAKEIDKELFENIDYITPNETEFEVICNKKLEDDYKLEEEMIAWQMGRKTRLIVTRGSYGVSYVENGQVKTVKSIKVEVKDTTGAGDTFNGAFARCIAMKMKLEEAIKFASRSASLSVTKFGAQSGMPILEEVKKVL